MSTASRDENNVTTIIGVDSTNGVTIVPVKADPISHELVIADGTTGIDYGSNVAGRDQNFVTTLLAVSSVDGVTPVEIYVDAVTGGLLVNQT